MAMSVEEFRKLMEQAKDGTLPEDERTPEERREAAMRAYLDDVAPISQFINEGFAEIERRQREAEEKKDE